MSASITTFALPQRSAGAIGRGRGVTFGGAQVSTAGAKPKGIAHHAVTGAGQDLTLDVCGTTLVETGGAFAEGDSLAMDAQGRTVAAAALAVASGATAVTSASANGVAALVGGDPPTFVYADALVGSTGAGLFVEVLLRR
ncbi:capsid cement protein [Pararoseomonas sp. SCSIO 73927]|uniref:capsid cement protein n=1 Tax=Pararoseomonas sp. SCSIO 73927 TaxID=3114537 RepID=UPI0030CCAB72